jgi:hypothetical protein
MGLRITDPSFLIQGPRPKQPTPSRAKPPKPLKKKREEPRRVDAGHVVGGQKLTQIVKDQEYYEGMHLEACFITGLKGTPDNPVVGMHIGNPGKGLKNDADLLPALKSIHDGTHQHGITYIIQFLWDRPHLLIAILRAYARERYFSQEQRGASPALAEPSSPTSSPEHRE